MSVCCTVMTSSNLFALVTPAFHLTMIFAWKYSQKANGELFLFLNRIVCHISLMVGDVDISSVNNPENRNVFDDRRAQECFFRHL